MRVLLVNRFFGQAQVPTGRMAADVVRAVEDLGHEVIVLTSTETYEGTYGGEVSGPGQLHFTKAVPFVFVSEGRLTSWLWFWLQLPFWLVRLRWDRCVLLTDPPFMWLWVPLVKRLTKDRRILLWSMDLYPEALVALWPASRVVRTTARVLRWLSEVTFPRVDGLIALGHCQMRRLRKYRTWQEAGASWTVVPPWDDRELERVSPGENQFLERHGLRGRRVVLYTGNIGAAHRFEELLSAARVLWEAGDKLWRFVFVCRGARKEALIAAAKDLPNVLVLDYVPPSETSALMHAALVHVITMAPEWEGIVVPSKLYAIVGTGSPVLFIGPAASETARDIEAWGLGCVVAPGAPPGEVISALDALQSHWTAPAGESISKGSRAKRVAAYVVESLTPQVFAKTLTTEPNAGRSYGAH